MRYRIKHITEYLYSERVSHCYNVAHMVPRNTQRQRCASNNVKVNPSVVRGAWREDYFGNHAYHFEIQRPHKKLIIIANSDVETLAHSASSLDLGISCQQALFELEHSKEPDLLMAREFLLDSPMIKATKELREYARPSFGDERSLSSAIMELTQRVYTDFTYCPDSTDIATPLEEVFENKRGVCQDFAHLQIACLRALGFPAKYVSGYLETQPAPGKEKLIGADATHAWLAAYIPCEGWLEFDPTNNCLSSEQHIVTAWGRDYFDVTPLRGVIFGGGESPILNVSVDVARL